MHGQNFDRWQCDKDTKSCAIDAQNLNWQSYKKWSKIRMVKKQQMEMNVFAFTLEIVK